MHFRGSCSKPRDDVGVEASRNVSNASHSNKIHSAPSRLFTCLSYKLMTIYWCRPSYFLQHTVHRISSRHGHQVDPSFACDGEILEGKGKQRRGNRWRSMYGRRRCQVETFSYGRVVVFDDLQEGHLGHAPPAVIIIHMVGEVEDRIRCAVLGDAPRASEENTVGVTCNLGRDGCADARGRALHGWRRRDGGGAG